MRADAVRNRGQIIDAARTLVAEKGRQVTMDELAERSGVAVGTVYRHFATKEDLVAAVVEESAEQIATAAETAWARVVAGGSPWAELTRFWAGLAEGPQAGRSTRLAADSLGIDLQRDDRADDEPAGAACAAASEPARRAAAALTTLLASAQDAGEMRADVRLSDLFLLLAQAPEHDEPRLRARYFELVSDGLRP